ncbi:uncharacterized protein LOC111472460 [Cucurbita maxima]|uniref:Uncharacterized protein LOC111472460 n=1 Tax=Cucurbita maxima TaxID=3661 RepID=A0A6J1I9U0_CUCMA|nr:uncharacterized protein LOC111472460 [Cucurbita maxima]
MSTCVSSPSLAAASAAVSAAVFRRKSHHGAATLFTVPSPHSRHAFPLRAAANDSNSTDQLTAESAVERSEADKIVDGMDFGELCNEFECVSSPLVESTARQLAKDILQLRQGDRSLGNFAVFVKYKDPIRKFTGREKYKRKLWATSALENPTTSVQEMVMVSTSMLNIKWTIKGKPKSLVAAIGGDLIIKVDSQFTLNQISGQVIEHEERWDVSSSSAISQAFFWASRYLFASTEAGKDLADSVSNLTGQVSTEKQNLEMFPDPSGDPSKFFEGEDNFQRDAYQFALLLAIIYFVVQFLKATL